MKGGIVEIKSDKTKKSILECARQEFITMGYHDASLRNIAKAANVTTGAIYRYFADKKALLNAATENAINVMAACFSDMSTDIMCDAKQGISYDQNTRISDTDTLYHLVYDHFDEFYILLVSAEGTEASSFLHQMVEFEEKSALAYYAALSEHYQSTYKIDKAALHFLIEAYMTAIFEPVRHKIDRKSAIRHTQVPTEYFSFIWRGIEDKIKEFGQ